MMIWRSLFSRRYRSNNLAARILIGSSRPALGSSHVASDRILMPLGTACTFRCMTSSNNSCNVVALTEQLKAEIRQFDVMSPRPMSLQEILTSSASSETIQALNEFLREEFCIRCAERICMLDERIPHFADIPELHAVYQKHIDGFVQMRNHELSGDFIAVVRDIVERGQDMVPLMCRGMARLIQTTEMDEDFINTFMNEFLLNRIGSNVLMSQYLAVATGDDPPHPTSIIDPQCNVTKICKETARSVQSLCYQETGFRPTIKVSSHAQEDMDHFAFIPAVISYIVQELLKNSAVATAKERHAKKKSDDNTISVVICADEGRVMIHVGDRAGGIPFDAAKHIWSYLYSTKRRRDRGLEQSDDLESTGATDLGGYGVGLPLSRLYASYLGGTINLVSLPGYGTHAYIFLPRIPENMVESVPVRATGWNARQHCSTEFIL